MKSINIKLSLAENVKNFVNMVNRYPYDMDLRAGRHVVDAKSILCIFLSLIHIWCRSCAIAARKNTPRPAWRRRNASM